MRYENLFAQIAAVMRQYLLIENKLLLILLFFLLCLQMLFTLEISN